MDPNLAEKGGQRIANLAGILAGVLFTISIFVTAVSLPPGAAPNGAVSNFPSVRAALTLVEVVYLVGLVGWTAFWLALNRTVSTRAHSAASGKVVGIVGVALLGVGSLVYAVLAHVSDLYHSTGAVPKEQTNLVQTWQVIQGLFNATDAAGLFFLSAALLAIGVEMRRHPSFGRWFGGVSMVLGALGLAGTLYFIADPLSSTALAAGMGLGAASTLIIFPLLLGTKALLLSRTR
ncbi:MAG: hypothetical protein L3K14_04900 [Thermoplasmata archaeon]|nr:hypothetical protein [Thermoplasmata archaeon]